MNLDQVTKTGKGVGRICSQKATSTLPEYNERLIMASFFTSSVFIFNVFKFVLELVGSQVILDPP